MSLVLDATPAGANSNAYCTAAEADAYHQGRGFNPEWFAATITQKEQVIVWATRLLDQLKWIAYKRRPAMGVQALRWPRVGAIDRDYVFLDPDAIPKFLKDATAEFAFYLLKDDRTDDPGSIVANELKVGPLSITGLQRFQYPASVLEIISPWLVYTPGDGALVRG